MSSNPKPRMYARFRDDIITSVDNEEEINELAAQLKGNSVLNFTIELSNGGRLPYLDVMITQHPDRFDTEVYIKQTFLTIILFYYISLS